MKINEIITDTTARDAATHVIDRNSIANINEFLQEKCPIAYNSPFKIYRGFKNNEPLMFIDSSLYNRKAANTVNTSNVLISDILPSWKKFPPRNRSFICATSRNITASYAYYGMNYRVYPIGDPIIGICSERDFWPSFRIIDFIDMNEIFLPRIAGMLRIYNSLSTYDEIVPFINSVSVQWVKDSKLSNDEYENSISYKIKEILMNNIKSLKIVQKDTSFFDILNKIYNPITNKFKCAPLSKLKGNIIDKEVWFSGPAYFEQEDYI